MSRAIRLLLAVTALVVLVAPPAAGAPSGDSAPKNLRAFLLRVDEPVAHSFPRTPSFAWTPVKGAIRYEFQLSTSNAFRENGIVYSDTSLTTPVAGPTLTLPWITGEPYALYARVRAVLEDDTTDWSASFGFDVEPSKIPAPLPSPAGMVRWTPIDGATEYDVWFVDIPKVIRTNTNVADEREFYTFHQAVSWLSTVRWRVRAVRLDFKSRLNSLPASFTGPWSPVYSSVNPPFATGLLQPQSSVSDVITTGAKTDPPHRLMPGFAYSGNQTAIASPRELYRVHVFTDRKCTNRVYTGAIVGSPAFAPRVTGGLRLPLQSADVGSARTRYLIDGDEGVTQLADGEEVKSNERLTAVKPTVSLPAGALPAQTTTGGSKDSDDDEESSDKGSGGSTPGAPAAPSSSGKDKEATFIELFKTESKFGPPVDLWDTDWANGGGYYWTVVPVDVVTPDAATTSLTAAVVVGATTMPVAAGIAFLPGDTITIGAGATIETAVVSSATPASITIQTPLKFAHSIGDGVLRMAGRVIFRDAEVPQDYCTAGKSIRFGKESEPTLTSGGDIFASGLTPDGELASAEDEPEFFGAPLVAWTPALGSSIYAVQWSKKRRPFKPETDPATGALGMLTLNTSAVLPLEPGTWYYRVRGYSFALPTGSQALSWSEPQQIVAARPEFRLVEDEVPAGGKELRVPSGGFSLRLPKAWSRSTASAAASKLAPLGEGELKFATLAGADTAVFVQSTADESFTTASRWARATVARYKTMRGRTGKTTCSNISLPAGAAVRCTLSVRIDDATQATVVYALQHRSATYTLTFASTPRTFGAKRQVFAGVARSFRFTS